MKRSKSSLLSRKQKKGWNDSYQGKETKKTIRLALLVLAILVLIIFFGKIFKFGTLLFNPWMDQKNSTPRSYTWDGKFNINVVLQGQDTFLLGYNPHNKTVVLIPLPRNSSIDVAYDMGEWQLGSIYNLGETSSTNGVNLVKKTMSAVFGVPIDGFIQLKGDLFNKKPAGLVDSLKKGPLNIFSIISDLKSDLTLWELIKLKFALSDVRFDKVKVLDLHKQDILLSKELPDKTVIYEIDKVRLDGVLSGLMDPAIRDENVSISVFNGTKEPFVAQKGARILTNIGGHVITTSNTGEKFKRTYVYGKESLTLKRAVQIFNSPCQSKEECDKIEPKLKAETITSRADINIILGDDFADIY